MLEGLQVHSSIQLVFCKENNFTNREIRTTITFVSFSWKKEYLSAVFPIGFAASVVTSSVRSERLLIYDWNWWELSLFSHWWSPLFSQNCVEMCKLIRKLFVIETRLNVLVKNHSTQKTASTMFCARNRAPFASVEKQFEKAVTGRH